MYVLLVFVSLALFAVTAFIPIQPINKQVQTRITASSAADAYMDLLQSQGGWYAMGDCFVLLPTEQRIPKSIIHFVGGFLAGSSAVTVAYNGILMSLAESGHLIVATPIPPFSIDHGNVAKNIASQFTNVYNNDIRKLVGNRQLDDIPVIGLSHSLGGKLTALMNSRKEDRKMLPLKAGNIFLSFNNYGVQDTSAMGFKQAKRVSPDVEKFIGMASRPEVKQAFEAVKDSSLLNNIFNKATSALRDDPRVSLSGAIGALGDQLGVDIAKRVEEFSKDLQGQIDASVNSIPTDIEFDPSPDATWAFMQAGYNVQHNVAIQFQDDDIDQSMDLAMNLRKRGCDINVKTLQGNHLTPLTPTTLQQNKRNNRGDVNRSNSNNNDNGFDDIYVKDDQDKGEGEAVFLRELMDAVGKMSDQGWEEKERRRRDKLLLPPASAAAAQP